MAAPLFLVAVVVLTIGGILLLGQFFTWLPLSKKRRGSGGVVPRALQVLTAGLVFVAGLFLLTLVLFARTYDVFTREEPIARIQCAPVEGVDYDMILRFVPLVDGREGTPGLFRLGGDQWAVGGHILQWHPWLNLLGLRTGYKITRIEGRYLNAGDEEARPRTVYDLEDTKTHNVWHWLYRHHEDLPLVRAVYGNTAYTFPERDETFLVVVTHSGFKVEPERGR
jgi:membrane protein implicated in regulation of membrane protease activity